jgi:dTDP-4-amino-4,6-dideoxygalactose transaminase
VINVTKTFLPPLEEYAAQLERVWDSGWVTNNGALLQELQAGVARYLGVPYLEVVNNGMIALQIAIKALGVQGEVITTPFSYVATTTAVLWEQCIPVFVDIEDQTFCIDPTAIEAAITDKTTAILATHVYGYPCDVEAIAAIARRHNLRVIYDAAHAFGSTLGGVGLLNFGDMATLSFHATKLFHSIEGGGVVVHSEEMARQVWLLKSFGHLVDDYYSIGTNGKMSEFHAAMGLCMLPRVDEFIQRRQHLSQLYDERLATAMRQHGLQRPRPQHPEVASTKGFSGSSDRSLGYNFSYYPVVFPTHEAMMRAKEALANERVNTRRYFYPSLNTLPYLPAEQRVACPVSESIASRVLCLPLYVELAEADVERIAAIITSSF